jgi:hypothetical protein
MVSEIEDFSTRVSLHQVEHPPQMMQVFIKSLLVMHLSKVLRLKL